MREDGQFVIENAGDDERLSNAAHDDLDSGTTVGHQPYDGSVTPGLPSYESRHHSVYDEAQDIPMQELHQSKSAGPL